MRWSTLLGKQVDVPEVEDFLNDIIAVCARHGMSLAHEDSQGGFLVQAMDEHNVAWLKQASDDRQAS